MEIIGRFETEKWFDVNYVIRVFYNYFKNRWRILIVEVDKLGVYCNN